MHRPPEGQGRNGVTRAQSRTGWFVPPRLGVSRFTILSRFFVMLVFLFCKLFEHYSQTNFHIIKTKPFKVTTYKKVWKIFRPKWVKIKIFVIILSVLLKIRTKIHITKKHSIQINQTVFYFQVGYNRYI